MKNIHLILILSMLFISCQETELKQFTSLSSDQTGIAFSNDITENDSLNYFTYPYMYMGGGVSVGDINNDGLVDLFFTSNMKPNTFYLNKGNLKFEDITTQVGLQGDDRWFTGTTMVDINNDGFLDLYVSVSGKGSKRKNQLYLNNGDLSFTEKSESYGIGYNGHTTQSTFFDFDNDGDLDLYLANYPPTPFKSPVEYYSHNMLHPTLKNSDILYRNNGDDTFTDVTEMAGVLNFGLSLSATAADVNNDGWKDIYVSNDFDAPDFLYINNQDGTFREVAKGSLNHTAQYGMGADIADYNNDALLDIAQVDMTPEDNRRSKANMSSMNPSGFNKMVDQGLNHQYMQNCLQLNQGWLENGNPIYSEVARLSGLATTDWSWAILFSDLDNDGWKDIMISNGTRRDINNRDYFLDLKSRNKFGGVAYDSTEIANIPSEKIQNYVFKNNGDLTFKNVVKEWGWDEKTFSNGAAYADLDNDGDLDVVVNNIDQKASVLRNNNLDKNNYIKISLNGVDDNLFGIGAKVYVSCKGQTQYQEHTLTRGFQSSMPSVLHFGIGKEQVIDEISVVWPDGRITKKKQVNANQNLILDYAASAPQEKEPKTKNTLFENVDLTELKIDFKHIENNYNDYKKEPLLPHQTSRLGPGLAVADINQDGLEDMYIGGAANQPAALYVQLIDGSFQASNLNLWETDKKHEDISAIFLDYDMDGDQDLYVVSGGSEYPNDLAMYQDRLYTNDGKGGFVKSSGVLPTITSSGSRAISADYDADGDLDLFIGGRLIPGQYPWPTKSYILNNEDGIFRDVTAAVASDFENIGMINDAVWTDFNGDETLDLILVGEWTPILFYENKNGKFSNVSSSTGLRDTEGWWSSVAQEDIDGDGDQDYIIGNLGLNYKYQASVEEPFEVYADDFDGNKRKDIVLSYYNFGKLFPVRGKSCSSQQMPALKTKFKNYNSFAVADISEIYGEEKLQDAEIHYKAKTFASVYIENIGAGKFSISNLPIASQFSSVNQIVIRDFDNDGNKDLLLGGNLYSSEIETPRNDSSIGVYLRGDGKGDFAEVANHECGLYMRGDVKDFEIIKIGNLESIIVAKNNEAPQIIRLNQ